MPRTFVYALPAELLHPELDGLQIAVRLGDWAALTTPDVLVVMVRPVVDDYPLRIWSAPLELVSAER